MALRYLLIGLLAATSPVQAAWQKASSPHFIIYADEEPAKLKAYAEKLEKFDRAVRAAREMKDPKLGESNRLTIFVVPDTTAVAKLMRGANPSIGGFYRVRAVNGLAVVPRNVGKEALKIADSIFFHEYAHYLMFQDFSTPMPSWLTEGFAEFYSMTDINADGSVGIGGAPVHRSRVLRQTRNPLPFSQMLAGANPKTGPERAALYARGWLLTHYLTFSKARQGQLERYLELMAAGVSAGDAAQQAFGSPNQLEVETEKYLLADKFLYLTLPASSLPIGEVRVTALSAGGQAIMPLRLRLEAGGDEDKAELARQIRAAAAPYPNDPFVQLTLAEAELADKRPAEARTAAERALAGDDKLVAAMMVMGQAIQAQAKAKVPGATFTAARGWYNRANRLDPESPGPLLYFYNSFIAEGVAPTTNAIAAMRYAGELAPQDMGLRLLMAKSYLMEGKKAEARRVIAPVAYYPHGGRLAEEARKLIEQINK